MRIYIILALLILASCGSRKAAVSINNSETRDITEETSKGAVTSENGTKTNEGSSQVNDIVNEQQEKRVRELFDQNGVLKERITELLNSKQTDKSTRNTYKTFHEYVFTDSTFNNTIYRDRTITIHTKQKSTDSSNKPLYWSIFGIGAILAVVWGVVRYLNR